MPDPIERMVRGVKRTISGTEGATEEDQEASETGAAEAEFSLDYDPTDIERRIDTVIELGLEPETFVVRLLREKGGRLKQQDFCEYTSWSESTTSCLLKELEEQGLITRMQLGREKIIQIADETAAHND